ncbi:transmembrane protein 81 [Clinocottus analis]|uniref:transmembrane protein 81 n=1 Tax=Clinocottus analis TaxID=304258 RepID=UPI0035BF1A35
MRTNVFEHQLFPLDRGEDDSPSNRNMQHVRLTFFFLLILVLLVLFLLHHVTSVSVQEADSRPMEVIVDSSACSATCGLGIKTQRLCSVKDEEKAIEEDEETSSNETEVQVSQACRVRKVKCLQSWQCGLRTRTLTSGDRLEIDCLGEVMQAMGRFSWRVSWRYARGIISSDDSLFSRWDSPLLDRVILDPIREEDAGTYRCVVQDVSLHRVKKVYWGIRVLPVGFLNLDYKSSLAQWDAGKHHNDTAADQQQLQPLPIIVLTSVSLSSLITGLTFLWYWLKKRRERMPLTGVRVQ